MEVPLELVLSGSGFPDWFLLPERLLQSEILDAVRMERPYPGVEATLPAFRVRGPGQFLLGSHRLVVRAAEGVEQLQAWSRLIECGAIPERSLSFAARLYEVRVPPATSFLEVNERLNDDPLFEFSEPVMLQPMVPRWQPEATEYRRQWQWQNDGSNGGVAGADLSCEAAWDHARGAGVKIAVIDNGMQVDHPSLRHKYERGGYFTDAVTGSGVFTPHAIGQPGLPDGDHGTFCAGMALAHSRDKSGGCGAAPEARLIAVACAPDQVGSQLTLARAIAYAADPTREDASASASDGADVISCSVGPNGGDWMMETVLEMALAFAATKGRAGRGTPIFWAVSNAPELIARDEVCSSPFVMAVGRSNRMDLPGGSAGGPELSFLAPGVDVYSTCSGGGYRTRTGASFAAPAAAGVAALILECQPTWSREQIRDHLRQTCAKIGVEKYANGRNDVCGYGRLDAATAVLQALPPKATKPTQKKRPAKEATRDDG
jgi:thermitase